jgi:hypothetical protein
MSPHQLAQFHASIPIGRLSEGSDFITGIDIPVDGGRCV